MAQKMIERPFGRSDGHRGRRVCGKYQIAAALPDAELVILPVLHHAICWKRLTRWLRRCSIS